MANECTSVVGHFDGHGGATVRYCAHRPMEEVQDFYKSHQLPPSGNYSFCIAPAAARATANKTTMQNTPPLLAILMAMVVRRYYTVHIPQWRWFMAFLKATKRCHRASTCSDITQSDMLTPEFGGIFHCQFDKKGSS